MNRLIALVLFAVLTALTSCSESSSGVIAGTGTLTYPGGECTGVWLMHADSGQLYEISSLDEQFQHSDLRVRFTLKPRPDRASGCMRGESADVVSMMTI